MNTVPGLGMVPLLVPGIMLLIAVRMVYAHRRGRQTDALYTTLTLSAWLLIVLALLGGLVALTSVLVIVALVFILVIAVFALLRFLTLERRMLVDAVALALERGIPLPETLRAFADERGPLLAYPAQRLCARLEAGTPLAEAAGRPGCRFPASVRVAIAASDGQRNLHMALRRSVGDLNHFDSIVLPALAKLVLLGAVIVIGAMFLTGQMYFIVPVFTKMFEDFELDLPPLTLMLISAVKNTLPLWSLAVLLAWATAIFLIVSGVLFLVGKLERIPVLGRLWWAVNRTALLRALAFAVQSGQPMSETIDRLAESHPLASFRRRLKRCRAHIERGGDWCDAFRAERLIRAADAAVLRSAQRVGNLGWALEETAEGALRRSALRLRAVLAIAFPIVIIGVGVAVGVVVLGLFVPLVTLIERLA